jgi:hypothetical protein
LYCDYSTIPWQGVSFLKELAEFQGMQAESWKFLHWEFTSCKTTIQIWCKINEVKQWKGKEV